MTDAEAGARGVGAEARHDCAGEEAGAGHATPASEGADVDNQGLERDDEGALDAAADDGTDTQREPDKQGPGHAGADDAGTRMPLEEALAQRKEYLDAVQRLKAEFENYRKRVLRDQHDQGERAGQRVVEGLLGAFDALDLAVRYHPDVVEPLYAALREPLAAQGLERLEPTGSPFDPAEHEAMWHEAGDEDEEDKAVEVEVLRPGYRWKGRLLRPAMVKVRG